MPNLMATSDLSERVRNHPSPDWDVTQFEVGAAEKLRSVQYFRSQSQAYHRVRERHVLKYLRAREREAVFDLARFDACSGAMIEVGCGIGQYALAAKAAGLHVTAVDVSPWAIDNLKGKVDVAVVGDVESLELHGGYDIVVCSGVLDYVSNPAIAFRNLCHLVGPGGRLVIQVPRAGIGGSLHAFISRHSLGLRINLFTVAWFAGEANRWGCSLARVRRPLPHNLVALFRRPTASANAPVL